MILKKIVGFYLLFMSTFLFSAVITVPLDNGKQDGRIKNDGTTNVGGTIAYIGDIANLTKEWHTLLGFNLHSIPTNATIISATLYFYISGVAKGDPALCNPYTVDHCDFGVGINPGDETAPNYQASFYNYDYTNIGWYGIPCTNQVWYALTNAKSWSLDGSDRWFQIRTRPTVTGTGANNYAKIVMSESGTTSKHPYLQVSYSVPSTTGPFYVDDDSGNDGNSGTFQFPLLTIQEAANRMAVGPPQCTISTTYIFPGEYNEKVSIDSNANNGYMVFTKLSNTRPVLNGQNTKDYSFAIASSNSKKIIIQNLIIKNYNLSGIRIRADAFSNKMINNQIFSNVESGIRLDTKSCWNTIISNEIGSPNQDVGVELNASKSNDVAHNIIDNNLTSGILITNDSSGNLIRQNQIYSNSVNGIDMNGVSVDGNIVKSNIIFGGNQIRGVRLDRGDNNIVISNTIFSHISNGIFLIGSAQSNTISFNNIYSNNFYGICNVNIGGDYNTVLSNDIWGENQNTGIYFMNGDYNIIRGNKVHHNQKNGIFLIAQSTRNFISQNTIYSNVNEGIFVRGANVEHNDICSNRIYGENQTKGIRLKECDRNNVYRNLIIYNKNYGIYSELTAESNRLINNTIYGSLSAHGVLFTNTSSATLYNNIILSNNGFGVQNSGSGIITIGYSDIYGNTSGPTNTSGTGAFVWGNGNWLKDPMLQISGDFLINSGDSYAYDQAKIIPVISDNFLGSYPDMGWKECSLVTTVTLSITKTVVSISDPLGGNKPIPGATIVYHLFVTNLSYRNGFQEIVWDELSSFSTYRTNLSLLTNWNMDFSTNDSPDISWDSTDFHPLGAVDKQNIGYLRWKVDFFGGKQSISFEYSVIIK